ncbi:Mak10 subunit, NatC N-terminal acetyltransferase-domain-containing protein [Powellomyces hirtus]|nr:Mak10 subunit, NatC N-terminal acetyltransferase-domain-containing protein [Powellomyces hirtus]
MSLKTISEDEPPPMGPGLFEATLHSKCEPEDPPWEDVTAILREATDELEIGQLVAVEGFSLWEGMCAIEMMDPKMDAGMDLPAAARAGKLTISDMDHKHFTAADIIGILDQLLGLEMSWIAGNMLCQTVFTCVCLHAPYRLGSSLLQSCVVAMLKTVDLVRMEVTKAHVYEEEDFANDTMGLSLCEEVQENEAIAGLLLAEDTLTESIRSLEMGLSSLADPEMTKLALRPGLELDFLNALLARIQFMKFLYFAIMELGAQDIAKAGKSIAQAKVRLETVHKTINLGSNVEDVFDPYITRKLFAQMPPKPILVMPKEDALNDMKTMLSHMQDICDVCAIQGTVHDLESVFRFIGFFSGRAPGPNVLTRSLLQTNLVSREKLFGRYPLTKVICESILNLSGRTPRSLVDQCEKDSMSTFCVQAAGPIQGLFKLFGRNRARQYRGLRKNLKEWEALQVEAEALDMDLRSNGEPPKEPVVFSSWVFHQKLNLMILHVMLGYEMDLYSSYEQVMVLMQIQHLFGVQEKLLLRLSGISASQEKLLLRLSGISASENSDHLGMSVREALAEVTAKKNLFRGLLKFGKVLRHDGHLASPDHEAYCGQVHFNHRFRVFQSLTSPVPLQYEDYLAAETLTDGPEVQALGALFLARAEFDALLEATNKANLMSNNIQRIRNLDYVKDLQALIRVCDANEISIKSLTTSKQGSVKPTVTIDRTQHAYIPVFALNYGSDK